MCNLHPFQYRQAANIARAILRAQGIPDEDDFLDTLDPDTYAEMVEAFADELEGISGPFDRAGVAEAAAILDVAWTAISIESQRRVVAEAAAALARRGGRVADRVAPAMAGQSRILIQNTKAANADRFGFRLFASFDKTDRRVSQHVMAGQKNYIKDQYGRHAPAFSRAGNKIVADGLERGLRTEAITADLMAAAAKVGINRPESYWRVSSFAWTSRARNMTQLNNFERAGIEKYTFSAVVDERTTDICRALDGKVWTVQSALRNYQLVEESPRFDAVKEYQPWVRVRKGAEEGTKEMFVKYPDGREVGVGTVVQSAVGQKDQHGTFRGVAAESTLADMGLNTPPLHGRCRSTIIPDIE